MKLPLGAVTAEGWLRMQLELMAEGFTGRLEEISPWLRFEGNAWVAPDGQGHSPWEELPYWLRGFVALGHVMRDSRIIQAGRRWIDGLLATQRGDGWFGPEANRQALDLWPNMVALFALRWHQEATGDERVIPFMLRYFRWQHALPLHQMLPEGWQKWRGADNLDSIHWLYNRTGEPWLLDLARVNHERTADWVGGIPTWHGVNICQGFRAPAQYFPQAGDRRYLEAAERNYRLVMDLYGRVPGGMFGADENCRPGYTGPRQGAETCSMAELMFSHQMLLRISGDAIWGDRCEEVAFNSLPASMTADLQALRYLTCPNQVQSDRSDKSPMIENGGPMFAFDPADHRCCRHNVAFAWPCFTENLWMATEEGGLAAVMYAPSQVEAEVSGGALVTILEETEYPFGDAIHLAVRVSREARFPLLLRVPHWCSEPRLLINGEPAAADVAPGSWIRVDRTWRSGDRLQLKLPMAIAVTTWPDTQSVSVSRGPLAYSLAIRERWESFGDHETWPGFEAFPASPWNYGLLLDAAEADLSIRTGFRDKSRAGRGGLGQPFTPAGTPVYLKAAARRIPAWQLEPNGLPGEVRPGPIRSAEPAEEVELIPMGCARLRLTVFPVIGRGDDARDWAPTPRKVSASHQLADEMLDALTDPATAQSLIASSLPPFSWWDHRGTPEWVQYTFESPQRLTRCAVHWFDDQPHGGYTRLPRSWRLVWWDGTAWQPVSGVADYPVRRNERIEIAFDPVTTTTLRLEVQLHETYSAGLVEWMV